MTLISMTSSPLSKASVAESLFESGPSSSSSSSSSSEPLFALNVSATIYDELYKNHQTPNYHPHPHLPPHPHQYYETTTLLSALVENILSKNFFENETTTTLMMTTNVGSIYQQINSSAAMVNITEEQMDRNIYILPIFQQIIWSFIFGSMVFAAAGGNIIVIWIVLTNKRMRTVTNYFLVNLSMADIMVSTLNVIFNFIYMLNSDWPFGKLYCKVTNFIAILSVAASVFTLMAISIDRYLAIVHPLRPRMSRTTTLIIIVGIWIASSLLSLPNYYFSTTQLETFKNNDSRVICYLEWYDGISTKSPTEYIYNVLILLVTYMLPIASMIYTYSRVGVELWGSQSIGECTTKQLESIKSKRKIVKMMMIVVAIFGICWAPYHIYFLLAHHYPQIISSEYVQHTYLTIYWLAMSNSVYNPLVYCWMNSRFRQGFRNVFLCACFRQQSNKSTAVFEQNRNHHGVTRFSMATEAVAITDNLNNVRLNGNLQPLSPSDHPHHCEMSPLGNVLAPRKLNSAIHINNGGSQRPNGNDNNNGGDGGAMSASEITFHHPKYAFTSSQML